MYIHIGNRVIVSDRDCLGIFNTKTIRMSEDNSRYHDYIESSDKTIIIDRYDNAITSNISSYTIINRICEDILKTEKVIRFNIKE